MIDNKRTFNLNEQRLNFTAISYTNYKNANFEYKATFKSLTSISISAINTLRFVWVIDLGITDYLNANQDKFITYKMFDESKLIYTRGRTIYIHGVGKVKTFTCQVLGLLKTITLHNVLCMLFLLPISSLYLHYVKKQHINALIR